LALAAGREERAWLRAVVRTFLVFCVTAMFVFLNKSVS
jgi:hypothetical protein